MRLVSRMGLAVALASLGTLGCGGSDEPAMPVELTFPFADPGLVVEIHNFGLHPWSVSGETHGGIDIVPPYLDLMGTSGMRKVPIVAPADGTIVDYVEDTSGAGLKSYVVLFRINTYWHLLMNFEPQSADAGTNAEQAASFTVTVGQAVSRGEKIGDLVVSMVEPDRYPHLHFGVFYKDPTESWDEVFDALRAHDGSAPSPRILDTNLALPSTFYCPYDHLLGAGQAVVDAVPKLDLHGNACSCACSYGSSNGSCGRCP
jgi:murein DD-endopeptidase MepM/ murein hydrolase activator NlpD